MLSHGDICCDVCAAHRLHSRCYSEELGLDISCCQHIRKWDSTDLVVGECFVLKFFEKRCRRTLVLSVGPLIPLFWTTGDVCPEFQSQDGSSSWVLCHQHTMKNIEIVEKCWNTRDFRDFSQFSSIRWIPQNKIGTKLTDPDHSIHYAVPVSTSALGLRKDIIDL